MKLIRGFPWAMCSLVIVLTALPGRAADYPAPKEGSWVVRDFRFHTDVAVPMASLPTEMSGRNWMTRRLIIDSIRNDPEWMNGNYTKQPRSLQFASVFYGIATNGGNQRLQKAAPTREKADQLLTQR
ncbi:MAG: hypothetical protein ACREK6_18100, partial [Candidatus Rokuibacteriota bacterium]